MDHIRIGIIGAGQISKSCCNGVADHDAASVVAVADMNAERLNELCDEFSIEKRYQTHDQLLADGDIDAVYVAVPNFLHAPMATQALNAGKHVILDKPFALNLAEAEEVAAAAKANGRIFMLGMNQRFGKNSQTIRQLVVDDVLGEIYHAKARWFRRSGIPKMGTWFGSKEKAGGGSLLDIGVHMLDLALFLMGDFDTVSVSGATYSKFGHRGLGYGSWGKSDDEGLEFDVDDFASAFIRMRNGATLTLDVTWACHSEREGDHDVELYGTEGGASVFPAKLFRADPLRTNYEIIDDLKPQTAVHEDRFCHFVDVICGKAEPLVTVEQAIAVQRLIDGIYESCRSGKEVRFD